ncbi:MAG: type II toxin-antitoxin system VapC family toxin [Gloeobacteraceae cyanobacterium ES-bin-144]|nr:type II toxin-antitoxin system VapC family toxin [Verrucomicrobiales bacterium]
MGLILDTNFIITAERELRRGAEGRTDRFLGSRPDETFFITFTVAGELACGQSAAQRLDWERLCRPYPVLPWTKEVSWKYGEIYRFLAAEGRLIGTNDLWIAATALATGMGVVTNNHDEFERVPGLVVIKY